MSRWRRWIARRIVVLVLPATGAKADHGRDSRPDTFQLLRQAIAGRPVEPANADPATLIKIAALLTYMVDPKRPAAVLDIVKERLAAAEDVAAVRHLFDEQGQPR
jgi:hypothetical protein